MTNKNYFLEENHSSRAQPVIAGTARGLQDLVLPQPALPFAFRGFPSLPLLFLQFSRSVRQPATRQLNARPSISLSGSSPPSRFHLPSPGHWLQPPSCPSCAAGTRTRRHSDPPCLGHARKLCLTLRNAQPLGTKNRSCARLDVFLSAGYTPSSRSIFSIGGTA